jgi:prepilin-type N-terminal cleavage/methylation domain-containing protein
MRFFNPIPDAKPPEKIRKTKLIGFTLIELLVVVAIIAVLISILLPALGQARHSARKIVCASQLKTTGQGLTIYASEHNGWGLYNKGVTDMTQWQLNWLKPYKRIQFGLLFKYVGGDGNEIIPKPLMCPEDVWNRKTYGQFGLYTSYMLNPQAGRGNNRNIKIDDLPSDRATVIDYCVWAYPSLPIEQNTNHKALGINILRTDGRVGWVRIEALKGLGVWDFVMLDYVH